MAQVAKKEIEYRYLINEIETALGDGVIPDVKRNADIKEFDVTTDYDVLKDRGVIVRAIPTTKIVNPIKVQRKTDHTRVWNNSRDGVFDRTIIKIINVFYSRKHDIFYCIDGNHTAKILILHDGPGTIEARIALLDDDLPYLDQMLVLCEAFRKTNDAFEELKPYTNFRIRANCGIHKYQKIWDAVQAAGCNLFYDKDNEAGLNKDQPGIISNVNHLVSIMDKVFKMVELEKDTNDIVINDRAASIIQEALEIHMTVWPTSTIVVPVINDIVFMLIRNESISKVRGKILFNAATFKQFIDEDNVKTPDDFHNKIIGGIKENYTFDKKHHPFGQDHVGAFSLWFSDKLNSHGIKNNYCPASMIKGKVVK